MGAAHWIRLVTRGTEQQVSSSWRSRNDFLCGGRRRESESHDELAADENEFIRRFEQHAHRSLPTNYARLCSRYAVVFLGTDKGIEHDKSLAFQPPTRDRDAVESLIPISVEQCDELSDWLRRLVCHSLIEPDGLRSRKTCEREWQHNSAGGCRSPGSAFAISDWSILERESHSRRRVPALYGGARLEWQPELQCAPDGA